MTLSSGQLLQGNYRIVGLLAQGGMGAVYLAEHVRLAGRRLAIKENVVDPNADPQTRAGLRDQFYVEARTLAALDHPNLPKVSDYFTVGNNEYLVMDFVEGDNLQDVFNRHVQQYQAPLPEKAVLAWADQVLDALVYLHGQRPYPIVHRDIKPGNIILTPTGLVKLVDFGLVKLIEQGGKDTVLALRGMGTPAYTALEQYPGSQSHTDARTDIYALGATLYHLLTGAPPVNVRDRLLNPKLLEKPRRLNPSLSSHTEAAILKAIEIHPDQRFQSASQMRAALRGVPQRTTAPAKPPRPAQPGRSRPWVAPVLVLLVALLLLAGSAWAWSRWLAPWPFTSLPTKPPEATIVSRPTPRPPATPKPTTKASPTAQRTATPTSRPVRSAPTATRRPTFTPTRVNTPTRASTPTPARPVAVATGATNLRAGPGTEYPVVGQLPDGGSALITGRNQAGTWWQLELQGGQRVWIIANRVQTTGPVGGVGVVAAPATPTAAATAAPARPGLLADFESGGAWRTGDQNYGQLTLSREQAAVGSSSARISYNFPAVTGNYVVFLAPSSIAIPGQPSGISAWVYGDGSGHYLNAWVQDAGGEIRAYTFGQVSHSGWQQMTAWLDDSRGWPNGHIGGSDNGRLDFPARLYAVVLDGVPDGAASSGVIYLDDLAAAQGAIPAPTATPSSATSGALLPGAPAPGQAASVGGLLGFGVLLGMWLVADRPRRGRP